MKLIKGIVFFIIAVMIGSSSTMGQRPENFTKVVTENLVRSLDHEVQGVVEASIYNSLFLAKYYPDANIKRVLNKLSTIAEDTSSPVVKYKAQLAVLYITNYSNSELNLEKYKEDQTELFREISQMLTSNLLVSK